MPPRQRRPLGPRGGVGTVTAAGLRKTALTLDPDELRALRRIAVERDVSLSELVRAAIHEYLERQQR
jgi:hypothetical protein